MKNLKFDVRRNTVWNVTISNYRLRKSSGKRSNAEKSDLIGLEVPQEKKLLSRSLFLFHLVRHFVEAMALLQLPKATIFQKTTRNVIFFISFHIHFLIDTCQYLLQCLKISSPQVHHHAAILKHPHQVKE